MHHGQEIYLFFFKFGYKGIFGAVISSIFIGLIIFCTLRLIKIYNINSYSEFLERINNIVSRIRLNKFINVIISVFLLISFYIMIAGFATFVSQELNMSYIIGSIFIAFCCYSTFRNNLNGIVKVNTYIIPILVVLVIIFGIMGLNKISGIKNIEICESGNWTISAILYASYNSIVLIPILISLNKLIQNDKHIAIISLASVFIIILLITSIYFILMRINVDISKIELPAVYIVKYMGECYKIIYGFVIIASIYTTAVSSGYSFLIGCSKVEKEYKLLNILICVSSVFISKIGFAKLVKILYPFFGILGLIQIFLIINSNFKYSIEKKK